MTDPQKHLYWTEIKNLGKTEREKMLQQQGECKHPWTWKYGTQVYCMDCNKKIFPEKQKGGTKNG